MVKGKEVILQRQVTKYLQYISKFCYTSFFFFSTKSPCLQCVWFIIVQASSCRCKSSSEWVKRFHSYKPRTAEAMQNGYRQFLKPTKLLLLLLLLYNQKGSFTPNETRKSIERTQKQQCTTAEACRCQQSQRPSLIPLGKAVFGWEMRPLCIASLRCCQW